MIHVEIKSADPNNLWMSPDKVQTVWKEYSDTGWNPKPRLHVDCYIPGALTCLIHETKVLVCVKNAK